MELRDRRLWTEIDLSRFQHNLKQVKKILRSSGSKSLIMGVVKADAYGHGAVRIARELLAGGAHRLAVSNLDEALQLREGGIMTPIQILSYTFPSRAGEIVANNLIQTVYDFELASAIAKSASSLNISCPAHLKIDTGMSRLGMPDSKDSLHEIEKINRLKGIHIEGIMTHFSVADCDCEATHEQFRRFKLFCRKLSRKGIKIPIKHVANSAAVMNFPEMSLDMVRPGIMLYGLYPDKSMKDHEIRLQPVMSLNSQIINIREFPAGTSVSYGGTFSTKQKTRIITVPAGYADGYSRILSNRSRALVKGKYAPVVGRICMDHFMADASGIDLPLSVGDEVVLIGESGKKEISADCVASLSGSINYEFVSRIGNRATRIYLNETTQRVTQKSPPAKRALVVY